MARSVALSRLWCINALAQENTALQNCVNGLLSHKSSSPPVFSERSSSFSKKASTPTVLTPGSPEALAKEARLQLVAEMRRKYEKEMTGIRKKYAAEVQEKRQQKMKVEEDARKEIEKGKEERALQKKERAAARAIEVAEEARRIKAIVDKQKAINVRHKAKVDAKNGFIRFKRWEAVRRESSMWIEEKDLERRILEAISNPFQLAGSSSVELPGRDDSYYEEDEA